jgi:hypothetical protein
MLQPGLQFGPLAVGLLAFGRRYAYIDAGVHANLDTPYFTGCLARIKVRIDAGFREGKERLPYFAGWACATVRELLSHPDTDPPHKMVHFVEGEVTGREKGFFRLSS